MKSYFKRDLYVLSFLITSLFYCLPIGRFSFLFFQTDFRIYDFSIFFFLIYLISNKNLFSEINHLFKSKVFFPYYLKYILILSLFSLGYFFIYEISGIFPAIIRLYRFFGFILISASTIVIARNEYAFKFLFNMFYINLFIQFFISFLQLVGVIENLWPEYWMEIYDNTNFPVATSSPHHKHIAILLLISICLSFGLINFSKNIFKKVFFTIITCLMFVTPLSMGTRTFMLAFISVFIFMLFHSSKNLSLIIMFVFVFFAFGGFFENFKEDVIGGVNNKVTKRFEKTGIEGLTGEREAVYVKIFDKLKSDPYLFFTGCGFQNMLYVYGPSGGHNNFLTALVELGILGFLLFCKFMITCYRNIKQSLKYAESIFIFSAVNSILLAFIGILVSMQVGETIWAQRAMFTLPGQCIFLLSLACSPYYWKIKQNHT